MREGRNGGKLKTGGSNGGGRPKKLPALDVIIADVLADEQNGMSAAEAILKVIRGKAIKGDLKAAEMLLNRAYGKPTEQIEHSGHIDSTVTHVFQEIEVKSNDSDSE